jgi:hypothetical protein
MKFSSHLLVCCLSLVVVSGSSTEVNLDGLSGGGAGNSDEGNINGNSKGGSTMPENSFSETLQLVTELSRFGADLSPSSDPISGSDGLGNSGPSSWDSGPSSGDPGPLSEDSGLLTGDSGLTTGDSGLTTGDSGLTTGDPQPAPTLNSCQHTSQPPITGAEAVSPLSTMYLEVVEPQSSSLEASNVLNGSVQGPIQHRDPNSAQITSDKHPSPPGLLENLCASSKSIFTVQGEKPKTVSEDQVDNPSNQLEAPKAFSWSASVKHHLGSLWPKANFQRVVLGTGVIVAVGAGIVCHCVSEEDMTRLTQQFSQLGINDAIPSCIDWCSEYMRGFSQECPPGSNDPGNGY